jgi:transposase
MKLTEAQCTQVVAFLTAGMRQRDVAAQFQVNRATIWKVASKAGFSSYNMAPLTPEMQTAATKLFRQGRSVRFVSRTLAVSYSRAKELSNRYLLAQTGSIDGRPRLGKLEEAGIRTAFRDFERKMAEEYRCDVAVISRLLRRRSCTTASS